MASEQMSAVDAPSLGEGPYRDEFVIACAPEIVRFTYLGLLGREPDKSGMSIYAKELSETRNLADVLKKIIGSPEFWDTFTVQRSPDLVRSAFRGLLGRDPEPKETAAILACIRKRGNLSDLYPAVASFEKPCVVFLHIQKTAGTSLQNHLEDALGPGELYREHRETLDRHSMAELSRFSVFAGHFNYDSLDLIPRKTVSIFSFFREPKDRLISLYNFWRAHKPDHPKSDGGIRKANELLIEDFFEDERERMSRALWNHMTWAVMGASRWRQWQKILMAQSDGNAAARIIESEMRPAIRKRLEEFAFIGLMEDFDKSVEALFRVLKKDPPVVERKDHTLEELVTNDARFKNTIDKQPITPRLNAALDGLVQLDNITYEIARDLYFKHLAGLGTL